MKNIRIYLIALSALVLTLSCFAEAQAQLAKPGPGPQGLDHTFVSTTGTDSAVCGAQHLPCRDFNAALSRTNAGGEVIALDSGIYAASNITVDKSVTLTAAPGVHAELYNTADNESRITVEAGKNSLVVLRNLYIKSKPGGTNGYGVAVYRVGTVQIENCIIDRFYLGIYASGTSHLTGKPDPAELFIKDTIIKNSLTNGMAVDSPGGSVGIFVRVTIDHCQFVNNGTIISGGSSGNNDGLNVNQSGRVNVRDSVATGNGGAGFRVVGGDLALDHCESSNNDYGVYAGEHSGEVGTATVSNSLVTNNRSYGFIQDDLGVFHSRGNNVVRRNGQNKSGTITVISGT